MGFDFEKEKREAMEAGNRALRSLREAQKNLQSAKNWEIFYLLQTGFLMDSL